MSAYWPEFLLFATAHIFSLISPGPDFLMVVQSSLRYCRRSALTVALGISCGEMVHVTYSLLGIGWLITKSLWVFNILKWLGAAYLIYLGVTCLKAKREAGSPKPLFHALGTYSLSPLRAFGRGFLTNALNVKAGFFTLSFFTVLVSPSTPFAIQLFYGAFIQVTTFAWFAIVSWFLTNPRVQGQFLGLKHWIERICGAVLLGIGIKLGFSKLLSFEIQV